MSHVTAQLRRFADAGALSGAPARRVAAVAIFVLLTAVGARLSVPLPGMVPVSMQTLVVLLAGMLLGPRLGAAAMTAYLFAGMAGLPVFVAGGGVAYLAGPTGGYLLAFPVAAALTGWIAARAAGAGAASAERGASGMHVAGLVVAGLAGSIVVFLGGWAQLALYLGDGSAALQAGVVPFLPGSVAKLAIAVIVATRLRRRTLGLL
jgi:biotin transport system substrate-specific component